MKSRASTHRRKSVDENNNDNDDFYFAEDLESSEDDSSDKEYKPDNLSVDAEDEIDIEEERKIKSKKHKIENKEKDKSTLQENKKHRKEKYENKSESDNDVNYKDHLSSFEKLPDKEKVYSVRKTLRIPIISDALATDTVQGKSIINWFIDYHIDKEKKSKAIKEILATKNPKLCDAVYHIEIDKLPALFWFLKAAGSFSEYKERVLLLLNAELPLSLKQRRKTLWKAIENKLFINNRKEFIKEIAISTGDKELEEYLLRKLKLYNKDKKNDKNKDKLRLTKEYVEETIREVVEEWLRNNNYSEINGEMEERTPVENTSISSTTELFPREISKDDIAQLKVFLQELKYASSDEEVKIIWEENQELLARFNWKDLDIYNNQEGQEELTKLADEFLAISLSRKIMPGISQFLNPEKYLLGDDQVKFSKLHFIFSCQCLSVITKTLKLQIENRPAAIWFLLNAPFFDQACELIANLLTLEPATKIDLIKTAIELKEIKDVKTFIDDLDIDAETFKEKLKEVFSEKEIDEKPLIDKKKLASFVKKLKYNKGKKYSETMWESHKEFTSLLTWENVNSITHKEYQSKIKELLNELLDIFLANQFLTGVKQLFQPKEVLVGSDADKFRKITKLFSFRCAEITKLLIKYDINGESIVSFFVNFASKNQKDEDIGYSAKKLLEARSSEIYLDFCKQVIKGKPALDWFFMSEDAKEQKERIEFFIRCSVKIDGRSTVDKKADIIWGYIKKSDTFNKKSFLESINTTNASSKKIKENLIKKSEKLKIKKPVNNSKKEIPESNKIRKEEQEDRRQGLINFVKEIVKEVLGGEGYKNKKIETKEIEKLVLERISKDIKINNNSETFISRLKKLLKDIKKASSSESANTIWEKNKELFSGFDWKDFDNRDGLDWVVRLVHKFIKIAFKKNITSAIMQLFEPERYLAVSDEKIADRLHLIFSSQCLNAIVKTAKFQIKNLSVVAWLIDYHADNTMKSTAIEKIFNSSCEELINPASKVTINDTPLILWFLLNTEPFYKACQLIANSHMLERKIRTSFIKNAIESKQMLNKRGFIAKLAIEDKIIKKELNDAFSKDEVDSYSSKNYTYSQAKSVTLFRPEKHKVNLQKQNSENKKGKHF